MKKLNSLLLSFSVLFMTPLWAMDSPQQQDPDSVAIAGLKHEHVLLALWNSASGGNDPMGQMMFLGAHTQARPTEEQARKYLQGSSTGGYFCMRKVSPPHGDTYYCKPFNDNHGKGRAQQVIQALRDRSLAGPMTLEDVFNIYIPVHAELGAEKKAEVEALRKAGKFEEARMTQANALREKEDARMRAFVKMGNMEAAYAIHRARTQREDMEVMHSVMSHMTESNDPAKTAEAQALARQMALLHLRQSDKTPVNPKTPNMPRTDDSAAPPPSPTQSPPPQSRTEAPNNDLSLETQNALAKGLRNMFGGAPKKPEPKK